MLVLRIRGRTIGFALAGVGGAQAGYQGLGLSPDALVSQGGVG